MTLPGVLEREAESGARIAALITLNKPTAPMKKEAAAAGIYDSPWATKHARVQLLTIEGLLAGTDQLGMPPSRDIRTFKQAPKAGKKKQKGKGLFDGDEEIGETPW